MVKKKQSIVVKAPTSAGKTVCSTYCAIIGKKTLFVVPSDELARQVAGIFRNMPNIMIGIITNKEPKKRDPQSPMKTLAGAQLKIKKAQPKGWALHNCFVKKYLRFLSCKIWMRN